MSISFIIPIFNESALVATRLRELCERVRQYREAATEGNEKAIEILVVDGNSRDSSVALAQPYVDQVIILDKPQRAHQLNVGARQAVGDIFVFLHLDTQLPSTFFELLEQFAQDQSSWGFFPLKLDGQAVAFRVIEWFISQRSALTQVATGDQVLVAKRSFFHQVDGFPQQPLMEDVAFSKGCRKFSKAWVGSSPVITSSRRWEHYGIVRTVVLMWALRAAYWAGVPSHYLSKFYAFAKEG